MMKDKENNKPEQFGSNEWGEESKFDDEEQFMEETEEIFEDVWRDVKEESKDLSKKELAKKMFVTGIIMFKDNINPKIEETIRPMKDNFPDGEETDSGEKGDSFWSDNTFVESISPEEIKQKEKTRSMKHDEDMNYGCRQCQGKMSAHNRDWHAGLCDRCFEGNIDTKEDDDLGGQ